MTGNSDRTERGAAVVSALEDLIDKAIARLKEIDLSEATALDVQRFVRATELTARADQALDRRAAGGGRAAVAGTEEDMANNDLDDSPEGLERLRDDLGRRLDGLDERFEQKGLAFAPGRWPAPRPVADADGAAGSPASGG